MANKEQIEKLRLRGETAKAKRAFLDYLAMGPNRSLTKLCKMYREPPYTEAGGSNPPPTRQQKTIYAWSSAYNWVERVKQVTDQQLEVILHEQRRALAQAYHERLAQPAERIKTLNQIAEMIVDHLVENKLMSVVVKQVGSGKNTRMVEENKMDVPAIQALRGLLDDLAKETGGRPKNVKHDHEISGEVTGKTIFVLPEVSALPLPEPEADITIIDAETKEIDGSNGNSP
jgi:hypothetical protein